MLACEELSLVARLIFAKDLFGLRIRQFCWQVILPLLMILGLASIPTYISASNVSEAKANETLKEEDDSGEKEKESELLHINLD